MNESQQKSKKQTRKWVLIADKLADRTITIGGILIIGAVLGMLVYLVSEVIPLFRGGTVEYKKNYKITDANSKTINLCTDEYKTIAAIVTLDGAVSFRHAVSGILLKSSQFDLQGKKITAHSATDDNTGVALGFDDGSVRLGKINFDSQILTEDQVPGSLRKIDETDSTDGTAVYRMIPGRQFRKIVPSVDLDDPLPISDSNSSIIAMNYRLTQFGERPKRTVVTIDKSGAAEISVAETKLNLFTRKTKTILTKASLPTISNIEKISHVLATDTGEEIFIADRDSNIYRYNVRDFDKPFLAEEVRILPVGVELTTLGFLAGQRSLVAGGSDGSVNIFFLLRRENSPTKDGYQIVKTRIFESHQSPVVAFAASRSGKMFATEDAKGAVWLRYGTTQKTLLKLSMESADVKNDVMYITPRSDGLIALNDTVFTLWGVNIPHPEISLATLFGKIWYEGYPEPSYTWQSTGATNDFEPKLSLVPLIFGTFKATFYSLLFAIPIALLAAIYTSEFLPHRIRNKVKPIMEIMASIPSVVLGFIAALVLAPIVETWIAAILLSFVVVPTGFIICAYLWQLLPPTMTVRLDGLPKFLIYFVVMFVAIFISYRIGPVFEDVFFDGNFVAWAGGSIGSATPFLFLLNLPAVAVLITMITARVYGYRYHTYLRSVPMPYSALLDLLRFLGIAAATVLISYFAAVLMAMAGCDARNGFIGTYVQRNTLVVGFAMGFAVIPLIYTLAEDALNAVPDHLRSASLGCGATPWQTAKWIILPAAASGVFSAIMIGMGRAVGETMIVVMSAGNTPLIDWNIFNGLRALSANIAVELPEAPKDGSLYRVLFFTGLVLFAMTFVINTIAELIRIHFRKKATEL